jgi:hypothetical protein
MDLSSLGLRDSTVKRLQRGIGGCPLDLSKRPPAGYASEHRQIAAGFGKHGTARIFEEPRSAR